MLGNEDIFLNTIANTILISFERNFHVKSE